MLLVRYASEEGREHLLALIVEGATETLRRDRADFTSTGMVIDGAEWLGAVTPHNASLLHLVDIKALLPLAVRSALFRHIGNAA
jgi:chemotaxis-related protein WspB